MTAEGIRDLAEIEDEYNVALAEIQKLKMIASLSVILTLAGYIVYLVIEASIFFKLYFWMSIFIFSGSYVGWNQKHSQKTFLPEDAKEIKKIKKESLVIFVCSVLLGVGIYIFLIK